MAGHLAKLLYGIPHVVTAHSLEPRRPWKAEQLGGGYRLSSWVERTAYEAADAVIAVQRGHARATCWTATRTLDPARVHVVHNGIDTGVLPARPGPRRRARRRRRPGPAERGVRRADHPAEGRRAPGRGRAPTSTATPRSCCAPGAPDTPEIAEETENAVAELSAARPGVIWVRRMLPTAEVRQLLSAATVFVCPSVYEPLGIVNLEAMACGTAVVASDVGGIPEVVAHGRTGLLVHYDEHAVAAFAAAIAARCNDAGSPTRAGPPAMGRSRAGNAP